MPSYAFAHSFVLASRVCTMIRLNCALVGWLVSRVCFFQLITSIYIVNIAHLTKCFSTKINDTIPRLGFVPIQAFSIVIITAAAAIVATTNTGSSERAREFICASFWLCVCVREKELIERTKMTG